VNKASIVLLALLIAATAFARRATLIDKPRRK
jgi:hypothetical protein